MDTGPQTLSSPSALATPWAPWGPPDHQADVSPLPILWIWGMARSPDAPTPWPSCLQPLSSLPLVTYLAPMVSSPLTPSWAVRVGCVCVCVCTHRCTWLYLPGDAQGHAPHGTGWGAIPEDLRGSHPQSEPHGRVGAGLGLESSPASWTLHRHLSWVSPCLSGPQVPNCP